MPINRLEQRPEREGTLLDITCDSDGQINKFIDLRDVRDTLPLHRIDAYYETFRKPDARLAALATLRQMLKLEALEMLVPKIKAPTLIIWGQDDRLVPSSFATRLEKLLPQASVHMVENCGHTPNESHANQVAQWIAAHVSTA